MIVISAIAFRGVEETEVADTTERLKQYIAYDDVYNNQLKIMV